VSLCKEVRATLKHDDARLHFSFSGFMEVCIRFLCAEVMMIEWLPE
jgi:hypothetical protein